MKFVLGVTTYNRLGYLKSCLEGWYNTRDVNSDWILVVADDGSTDGTLEYLESTWVNSVLPNIDVKVIKNQRHGVHHQANQILKYASGMDFDFGFKIDDDIQFLKSVWDLEIVTLRKRHYTTICVSLMRVGLKDIAIPTRRIEEGEEGYAL